MVDLFSKAFEHQVLPSPSKDKEKASLPAESPLKHLFKEVERRDKEDSRSFFPEEEKIPLPPVEEIEDPVPLPPPEVEETVPAEDTGAVYLRQMIESIAKKEEERKEQEYKKPIDTGAVSMAEIAEITEAIKEAEEIKEDPPLPPPVPYHKLEVVSFTYLEDVPGYEEKIKRYDFACDWNYLGSVGNPRLYKTYTSYDMAATVAMKLNERYGKGAASVSGVGVPATHQYKVMLGPKPKEFEYADIIDKTTRLPLSRRSTPKKKAA